jgi:membrane protease YdiL (CAAX protease family)
MLEPGETPGTTACRNFHWCLAAVLFPVVSLPFEWFAAYRTWPRVDATREHRRWSRLLVGLAAVDTVVAAVVIALLIAGVWGWYVLAPSPKRPRSGDAVRIGVTLATDPETAGARISWISGNSPAERAGLRPGDVVVSLDETPIRTGDELARLVRGSSAGVPRMFRVRRDGQELELSVTPELRPEIREPPRPLFEATPTPSCLADSATFARALVRWRGLWAGGVLILLFWLGWRRLEPRAPPLWSWVAAALGAMLLVGPIAFWGVCVGVGGRSTAGPLVASLAQTIAALIVALIAMRSMARQGLLGARLEPILGARRAIVLGFFYVIAVNTRLTIFSFGLEALARVQWPALDAERNITASAAAFGWSGAVLLALMIVLVGPVEEEVLFRGVLLPRLMPRLGAAWAIVVTSVIFAVLHEGFGREPLGLRPTAVFVIALAFGWARLRTGGLSAPIAMHVVTNAIMMLGGAR